MYKIVLKKKAKKFIDKLPLNEKKRIVAAIESSRKVKISRNCKVMIMSCVSELAHIVLFTL